MAITTNYDVMVKYRVSDKATRGIRGIGLAAGKASRGLMGITRGLGRIVALSAGIGAGFGLAKGVSSLISVNAELEKTQAGLRTIIQLNTGKSFATSNLFAEDLMNKFRKDAKSSAGTFKDMAKFASNIAAPVTQMGGSLEDLREITKGAVVAAAAFGERSDLAQLDITQALNGTLGSKDRFAKQLGIDPKSFNKLLPADRLKELKRVLGKKAIKDAAKSYETSFAGVTSTLKSNLEAFAESAGKPLFQIINKELARVNAWFQNNEQRVKQIAQNVANGFVKAFEMGRQLFGFIDKHKELLMMLAKAMLVGKIASGIAGPFMQFNKMLGISSKAMAAFGAKALAVAASFAAGYKVGTVLDKKFGISDKVSDFFASKFGGYQKMTAAEKQATADAKERNRKKNLARGARAAVTVGMHGPTLSEMMPNKLAGSTEGGTRKNQGSRQYITVNMEVASDDPDRFVIGLEDYFERAVTNPSQADSSFRK